MLRKITFPLSDYGELSLVNPSFRSPLFMSKHVEYKFSDHMTLFCGSHDNLFKITCLESNRFGFKFPTAGCHAGGCGFDSNYGGISMTNGESGWFSGHQPCLPPL